MTGESFGIPVPYWDCAYCQAANRNARNVCFSCGLSEADGRWEAGIARITKLERAPIALQSLSKAHVEGHVDSIPSSIHSICLGVDKKVLF